MHSFFCLAADVSPQPVGLHSPTVIAALVVSVTTLIVVWWKDSRIQKELLLLGTELQARQKKEELDQQLLAVRRDVVRQYSGPLLQSSRALHYRIEEFLGHRAHYLDPAVKDEFSQYKRIRVVSPSCVDDLRGRT